MEGGKGEGDSSFVQGLGEFCFPSGASIALVDGREAVSRCPPQLIFPAWCRRGGLRGLLARRPTTKKKSTLRFVIGLFPRRCFVIGLLALLLVRPFLWGNRQAQFCSPQKCPTVVVRQRLLGAVRLCI